MKRGKRVKLRFLPVCLGGGAGMYFLLVLFAYIIAQTVPSAFFHAVFRLCLCLPLPSILCLLISRFFLHACAEKSAFSVQRLDEGRYALIVSNNGILPISCIRVSLEAPMCNGEGETVFVSESASLPSFSSFRFEFSSCYDRRGVYKIGADAIYIYDMMHLLRIRKKIKGISDVTVLPRMLDVPASAHDGGIGEELPLNSQDKSASYDYGDIREYRIGDSMKRIHWNLSSKSEELQVKRYADTSEQTVCVICDRGVFKNNYGILVRDSLEIEDLCIEESLSYVTQICYLNGSGCIIASTDDGLALRRDFFGNGAEKEVRAWLSELGKGSTPSPYELIPDGMQRTVYLLPFLSLGQLERILSCQKAASGTFSAHICDVSNFISSDKREKYGSELERLTDALSQNGISFYVSKMEEVRNET